MRMSLRDILITSSIVALLCNGCAHQDSAVSHREHEEVELALLMKNVSYFTHKLGLAIAAKNTELADFYIHEVEEGLEEIYGVSTYDKLPIGDTAKKIMPTAFAALEHAIDAKAQEDMTKSYQAVIESCNRCHNATQHGYLKVLVPVTNPFNQDFTP